MLRTGTCRTRLLVGSRSRKERKERTGGFPKTHPQVWEDVVGRFAADGGDMDGFG